MISAFICVVTFAFIFSAALFATFAVTAAFAVSAIAGGGAGTVFEATAFGAAAAAAASSRL